MQQEEKINCENFVKLSYEQLIRFSEGRPILVEHPTKGTRRVDTRNAYVNTFDMDMTEEEKSLFK